MIVPLQRAFGWDVATIFGAVSLNIILLGATGPYLTGLIEVICLKRTILACMTLIAGTGLSNFMTAPWQLFTWGLMVGVGSGAGAIGIAAAIANRWFAKRNGLACPMASLLVLRITRTQPDVCSGRLTGPRARSKRRS
jgi:hypothetical protein